MSESQVAYLELSFEDINGQNKDSNKRLVSALDCLTLSIKKPKIKLYQNQKRTISILIELDINKLMDPSVVDQTSLRQPLSKLLIARLKNSSIYFSFFIVLNLIDSSDSQYQI